MKIKISATYEGNCMICGKEKIVFSAGDEDTNKVVTICEDCTKEIGDVPTSDVIEKYGKTHKDAFKPGGIEIKGLEQLQTELKKRKEQQQDRQRK